MRLLRLGPIALALLGSCSRQTQVGTSPSRETARIITSADQLIDAMRERYAATWYRTITFVQKSSYVRDDGTVSRAETWYEAGAFPGKLRIDLGDPAKGNGALYRGDTSYSFQAGQIADRRARRNPLLVLGFDVYTQPPAQTLEQIRAQRIDVTVLHVDSLDGRRVYVVGAGPRDTTSNQFWVDAERLLFVRLIQASAAQPIPTDTRFEKYVQYGKAWVSEDVRFLRNGRMFFREEYSQVRVNVPLDENLWVPEKWSSASHWYKP